MYLRETRQKRADGSVITHLQLAESVWNPDKGRSETRILYNCGRAGDPEVTERLRRLAKSILRRASPEAIVAEHPGWQVVNAWPYGEIYALEALWARLGIAQVIEEVVGRRRFDFPVERALFAMVAHRACAPASKLYCFSQWLASEVCIEQTAALALQHLYRAMDFLEAKKEEIERAIYFHVADLLSLDVDLIFYDTTSLHFEVDDEDHGVEPDDLVQGAAAAGAKPYAAPRKRGNSKNGRGDAPQIVVGLAVTRDGFPVRHWVFPGNTVDVSTVEQVKRDLKGWQLSRCLFVGDAGMVSQANLKMLAPGGGKYLVCVPMRRGDEVTHEVLARPGRYHAVADNLRVKEVVVGDGERRRRYIVCHSPQEAERERLHRTALLTELEAELASLHERPGAGQSKRACALLGAARFGRYLKRSATGHPVLDPAKVKAEARLDGKFVVTSNDDALSPEDMALGYKQLARVEEAWRTLKSGLKLRPVYHWAVHRIHAHVALTVLALLLERVAEHACRDTWRNIRDDLKHIKLAQLLGPNGTVWQVTEPIPAAAKRLKALNNKNPPPVLHLR
jgi:hypothetical protein